MIDTTVIDVIVSVVFLISIWILTVQQFFTEAGLHPIVGCGVPLISFLLVFVVLYPVRYVVAGGVVGLVALSFLYRYLVYHRPKVQYNHLVNTYYGEALRSYLSDYEIVPITAYAIQADEADDKSDYVCLFIEPDIFAQHIADAQHVICRWVYIEMPAMPAISRYQNNKHHIVDGRNHKPQLFITLVVESESEQPIAIPLSVGSQNDDGVTYYPNYLWTLTLKHVNRPNTSVKLYGVDKGTINKVRRQSLQINYFMEHTSDAPHLTITTPQLDESRIRYGTERDNPQKPKKNFIPTFHIYINPRLGGAVEVAHNIRI